MNKNLVFISMFILFVSTVSAAKAQDAAPAANAEAAAAAPKPVDPNATIENGKKIKFDYTLKVDGQVVETSEGKEPLEYTHGSGDIIPGLETQLVGLKVGDSKNVVVEPKDAYGEIQPDATKDFPLTSFPEDFKPAVGMVVQLEDDKGNVAPAMIKEIKEDKVILDFNHPLAGKTLEFDVKVVAIE